MKNIIKNITNAPFYIVLTSAYPALQLISQNLKEVAFWVVWRPLGISIVAGVLLYLLLWLMARNSIKAGAITVYLLLLFYSYGHVYKLAGTIPFIGAVLSRQRYLLPIFVLMAAGGTWLLGWRMRMSGRLPQVFNLVSVVLILMPIGQAGWYTWQAEQAIINREEVSSGSDGLLKPDHAGLPDIYYFILDTYTRQDILAGEFGFDNSPFLDQLRKMGFYVAECSRANYASTELSLATSLNYNYLDRLDRIFRRPGVLPNDTHTPLPELVRQSRVRSELAKLGYKTVAFETGYAWTSIQDADYYFTPENQDNTFRSLNSFEVLFLETTILKPVLSLNIFPTPGLEEETSPYYQDHVERQRFILNKIQSVPQIAGPKFVFVHVLIPHYPFIFKPDGSLLTDIRYYQNSGQAVNEEFFVKGYVSQVQYINNRLLPILHTILAESSPAPIIIIQGDHGPKGHTNLPVLNAYYLPDEGSKQLYPSISPVNSFRVIFNTYFGTNLSLLPDVSRFSTDLDRYRFTIMEETNPACKAR
ncbi:MAG TPA: hypothetical protein VIO61_17600 [Anaerolineaceae bacterium]